MIALRRFLALGFGVRMGWWEGFVNIILVKFFDCIPSCGCEAFTIQINPVFWSKHPRKITRAKEEAKVCDDR